MRSLLHMPLDPSSRAIRLMLAEKGLSFRLVETAPWHEDTVLIQHNPARTVPVLIDEPPTGGEVAVAPGPVIAEYLEEAYETAPLLPGTSAARAEARRIGLWFEVKFESEVNSLLLRDKIDARLMGRKRGHTEAYRIAIDAMRWHLDYVCWLLESRIWLAGEKMSIADIVAAAHLSANDYIDAVPWREFPSVKEWYTRLKCRPSFRPLLADRVDGVAPAKHYVDLDF